MRKEVIFAILSGSALGLVIAFGVWRANMAIKSAVKTSPTPIANKVDTKLNEYELTIASPKNQSIFTTSTATIKGVTKPNSEIVIVTKDEDFIGETDTKGEFEVKVDLAGGINNLKIVSMDPNDGSSEQNLTLIYSSEFAKFLSDKTTASESTEEADVIRNKVKEKLTDAAKNPLAYMGIVTDITDTTIQIKNDAGEIQQVSLSADTEYVKLGDTNKKVELKDLAIGDYLANLGFKNSNNVLEGKRILITSKPADIKFMPVLGTVKSIDTKKKEIALKDNKDKDWTAQFGKKWAGPNLTEVETEQKIIVVGTISESAITTPRTLELIDQQ